MKTSELRKWLDKSKLLYLENDDFFVIHYTMLIYKNVNCLKLFCTLHSLNSEELTELIKIALEYYNTPLNEREDEKKYYIEFGGKLDKKDKKRYLNLNTSTNVTFFHHDWLDLIDLESGCLCYKGKFTQSEIDNFPKEIKGAIECGFLRKVEVE